MFEEVIVWDRIDSRYAIRYYGLRDLKTCRVWIAYGNHLGLDDDRNVVAEEVVAGQATLEAILGELPEDVGMWKTSVLDAIKDFVARSATAKIERLSSS